MKNIILILSCFWLSQVVEGQNLVKNYSFEERIDTTYGYGRISNIKDWSSFSCSVDFAYFEQPEWALQEGVYGTQAPATGKCMAGFVARIRHDGPITPDIYYWRIETPGTKLIKPLEIGKKYFVSFKVSAGDRHKTVWGACNKLGAKFTMRAYEPRQGDPIPNYNNDAHVYSNEIISDTVNWTTISGSFEADSAYPYLAIGKFFDDEHTDTLITPWSNFEKAWEYYYFLDDVCVTEDSLGRCDQGFVVGFHDNYKGKPQFKIYPNPVKNYLYLQTQNCDYEKANIQLYNMYGELKKEYQLEKQCNDRIEVSDLPAGIYTLQIEMNNEFYLHKFLITK